MHIFWLIPIFGPKWPSQTVNINQVGLIVTWFGGSTVEQYKVILLKVIVSSAGESTLVPEKL